MNKKALAGLLIPAFFLIGCKTASLQLIGRYAEDQKSDESMAEIVDFHAASKRIAVINSDDKTVDILDASALQSTVVEIPESYTLSNISRDFQLDVSGDVNSSDFESGGINSVAIHGNLMAVAIENDDKQANGLIAFYQLDSSTGAPTYIKSVPAGALPDNVVFSNDGLFAIAANEGEPSDDYMNDPEGSVTLVSIQDGMPSTVTQISFNGAPVDDKVRLSRPFDASVAQDLEPEYIAVSEDSKKAFVAMQENNAFAVIDLATAKVENIFGFGYKDHSLAGNGIDASNKDDAINITTYANVRGLYMPDTVASFKHKGVNYLVTANEGDAREYLNEDIDQAGCEALVSKGKAMEFDEDDGCLSWIDEERAGKLDLDSTVFPNAKDIQQKSKLGRIKSVSTEGDVDNDGDYDVIYTFGARSFSIWNTETGEQVFDSGDDFEKITAERLGEEGFNSTDNENGSFDDRSDDKGPEPEALAIGAVNGVRYAFIGLERTGGIMMYDISKPSKSKFVQYVNNRNYSVAYEDDNATVAEAGDLAPEGMKFVTANESPTGNALLIVGNEVSGSTTVYEVK